MGFKASHKLEKTEKELLMPLSDEHFILVAVIKAAYLLHDRKAKGTPSDYVKLLTEMTFDQAQDILALLAEVSYEECFKLLQDKFLKTKQDSYDANNHIV